jgi:hypothetical protein
LGAEQARHLSVWIPAHGGEMRAITAESFYAWLGFKAVRDNYFGDERTITMERSLNAPL